MILQVYYYTISAAIVPKQMQFCQVYIKAYMKYSKIKKK